MPADVRLPNHGQQVIVLHPHDELFQQWAAELTTPEGGEARRTRVAVEHALARLSSIQGNRDHYRGLEKVQFHTMCSAVVANLHVPNGLLEEAA